MRCRLVVSDTAAPPLVRAALLVLDMCCPQAACWEPLRAKRRRAGKWYKHLPPILATGGPSPFAAQRSSVGTLRRRYAAASRRVRKTSSSWSGICGTGFGIGHPGLPFPAIEAVRPRSLPELEGGYSGNANR